LLTEKIDAVNLANNHIHDKGSEGISETITNLNKESIHHFGAGGNITEASIPYWLNDDIAVFGYCEFGRSYLKQIMVADKFSPGINPLRENKIICDLDSLPAGKKAILYFHWGREHVALPPYHDILLAKKLLRDERVLLIVGTHAHRIQGYIKYKNKYAYMSIGNMLFPNFFMTSPCQIVELSKKPQSYKVTRQYHRVYGLTYKKWYVRNRISILLKFDLTTKKISRKFIIQDDAKPVISEINDILSSFLNLFVHVLSFVYLLPESIYLFFEKLDIFFVYTKWRIKNYMIILNNMGIMYCFKKLISKMKK
jgi:poly-gamma-glutamate synthesis protein (capsule biosynthesis protein)